MDRLTELCVQYEGAADVLKMLQDAPEDVYLKQLYRCRELRREMQELTPDGTLAEADYRVAFVR